jgi:drug/metabolite transporter (DMT)-like permease
VLLSAIWGLSFLLIKVGDQAFAPLQVAFGRMVFGALTLLVLLWVRRDRLPRDPATWGHLAVAALLLNAVPFTLYAYGETHVSSIVAGIFNATTPILTILGTIAILPSERPTRERVVALGMGFAGVLLVLGVWRSLSGNDLAGSLMCLGAAAAYGLGFPYTRRFLAGRRESTVALSTAQVLCATVELAVVTPFLTSVPMHPTIPAVASVIVLGGLGTGVAYILNYGVIRLAGAMNASTVTYLIPIFATLAGVAVLREPIAWYEPAGMLVILLSAAISQGRVRALGARTRRRFTAAAPAAKEAS